MAVCCAGITKVPLFQSKVPVTGCTVVVSILRVVVVTLPAVSVCSTVTSYSESAIAAPLFPKLRIVNVPFVRLRLSETG